MVYNRTRPNLPKSFLRFIHDPVGGSGEGARFDRLLRGGSWNNNARNCRSANRNNNGASIRNNNVGFRLVWVQPSTPKCQSR